MSDPIERQDAINEAEQWIKIYRSGRGGQRERDAIKQVISGIKKLPSAQPERKKGHLVEIGDEPYDEWECNVCGFVIDGSGCIDPEEYRDVYKFCPNCGADMRGKE